MSPTRWWPGGDLDASYFGGCNPINWAAVVEVTGVHDNPGGLGDGLVVGGAASLIFDLELRHDSPSGPLVAVGHAPMVNGMPTGAGFFSSINDGDCEDPRCFLDGGPSPELNAAFTIAFDIDGDQNATGRLFDPPADDGPYLDVVHYPSADGLPAGSSVPPGTLLGMGAAYGAWDFNRAEGVGLVGALGSCDFLGVQPLFEGQIDMSGLPAGTYALVLTAGAGNDILPGDICAMPPTGAFSSPANVVIGDTIIFEYVCGPPPPPTLLGVVSVKEHGSGAGTFSRPVAFGVGSESEGRKCDASKPLTLVATYDMHVEVLDVSTTVGTITSVTVLDEEVTIVIAEDLPPFRVPSSPVINLTVAPAGYPAMSVTDEFCVQLLFGDTGSPWNWISIFDLLNVRSRRTLPVDVMTFRCDVDANGVINIFDLLGVRNVMNNWAVPCP